MHRRTLLASAGALATVGRFARAKADTPGVTATEIKIGNTCAYSGPASAYGPVGLSEAAYFKMVNDQGGIGGRKINFISLDDGYSPPRTVAQTRRLVEEEGVAFMFQGLGTPTQMAVRRYLNDKQVPQLFGGGGVDQFADPEHFPWTMGLVPSYRTEAAIYGKYILQQVPAARIGVLYQNDDFGRAYLLGLKDTFGEVYAKVVVKEVSYETTDPTIDSQVVSLQTAGVDVVLTAATPKWAAQMIRKIAAMNWKPLRFLNYTASYITATITPAGPENAIGIITAVFVKDCNDPQWTEDSGMKEWRVFMRRYMPQANVADSLYETGHFACGALMQVLRQCGDDLSRVNIMKQAANLHDLELPLLLPGVKINTSPTNFHPIRSMQLARFNGRSWELFGSIISA